MEENEKEQKSIFILDSYGLIYRDYYAFKNHPLTNRNGENISAIYGFFNNIALTLKNLKPDMMVVALDSKIPTFRHEKYPEYKANRTETPDDLKAQFPWIEDVLSSLKLPAIRVDGFEADDIIATLTKKASEKGYKVYVLSGDKDLLQLVDENIHILRGGKKDKSKMWEEVDAKIVEEEWGVPPVKICDVLSLTGDSADNVPGVKGVGDKTAVKFINQYGTLENLYEHASEIKGAIGEKVRSDKENAFFSKELISLRYDVEIPNLDFDNFLISGFDYKSASDSLKSYSLPKVSGMFLELATGKTEQTEEIEQNKGNYKAVTDKKELLDYVQKCIKEKKCAFDTETDGLDTRNVNLVGFSLSCKKGEGIYVPLILNSALESSDSLFCEVSLISKNDAFEALHNLFDSDVTISMHNAKFDLQVLLFNGFLDSSKVNKKKNEELDLFSGIEEENEKEFDASLFDEFFNFKAKIFDTMIASWIIEPDRIEKNAFSLEFLSEKLLHLKGVEFAEIVGKGKTFADVPLDIASNYGAEDSDFTLQLYEILSNTLKNEKLETIFDFEMKILPILSKMEIEGIHINPQSLKDYEIELTNSLNEIQSKIFEIAGHSFNISSTKQLGEVMFEEMGLKGKRKTKTGSYSTDEESLKSLEGNPFVDQILDFRSKSKLLSTYVESLQELSDENDRVHTSFIQTGTATGRLSSRDPNLQNIPVRDEEGRRIRKAFTASDGKVLISADYAQIELVVLAHLSGDENLCAAFNDGVDVHKSTASLIYGVPIEEVSTEQRRAAKTFNFGIMYGMSAYRLGSDLKIGYREAEEFINSYFEIYAGVKEFFDNSLREAEETGYTKTISGRRRQIKNISASNANVREAAIRIAKNSPIQGSAADIVKKAMLDIDCALKENPTGAKLLLQVHDELIFECNDNEESISNTIALVKDKMEHAYKLKVPLRVSIETGKNWGEFH